ncbi:MAG: MurR/RpiR family transcriptional regulator, partial [Gammaproteobacteria bacterium]|nr:MurR/RpiR family transcriptional regulator [Gammaproteobacteria bacterium]
MLDLIKAMRSELSKAEKKVADVIIKAPQECVKITMKELAEAANVSEPTIVRFCRSLKQSGYREFRMRLTQDLASQLHYQHSPIDAKDNATQLAGKVFNGAISSLSRVRDQLSAEVIDQVIALLSTTPRVEIYGVGGAGIVVQDAHLKFDRLGLNTQSYTDCYLQR